MGEEGEFRDTVAIVSSSASERLDTLETMADRWMTGASGEAGWAALPHLLTAEVSIASSSAGLWVVDPESSWVGLWSESGELERALHLEVSARPDVDSLAAEARRTQSEAVSSMPLFREVAAVTPTSSAVPPVRGLLVGSDGSVWGLEWTVSGRGGRAWQIGPNVPDTRCVSLPVGGTIHDVADDQYLVAQTDSLGRPEVAVWTLSAQR